MKFLCVPCDKPMTMMSVSPPDRGSLSVVYGCPAICASISASLS